MLHLKTNLQPDLRAGVGQAEHNPFDDATEILRSIGQTLRRQIKLIASVLVAFLLMALAYVLFAPKMFTAETTIYVDERLPGMFSTTQGVQLQVVDSAAIDSEAEVLKSERIALRVMRSMKVLDHPELIQPYNPFTAIPSNLLKSVGFDSKDSPNDRERKLVDYFQTHTKVERSTTTYLISVNYTAPTPQGAAAVANAIADAYLTDSLEAKFESTKLANAWLSTRTDELRRNLLAASQSVQDYKVKNGLVDAGGVFLNEKELTDISGQITTMRGQANDAQARYDQAKTVLDSGTPDALSTEALNDPVIQHFRSTYLDLQKRLSDLTRRYGAQHQATIQAQQDLEDTRKQILGEVGRVAQAAQSEMLVSNRRIESMQADLEKSKTANNLTNDKRIALAGLQHDLDGAQTLYDTFLTRFKTTAQDQTYPISEARVVSVAAPPRKPSQPKSLMLLSLAGVAGLLVGAAAGLLRERFDHVIRTGAELASLAGSQFLGSVPIFGEELPQRATAVKLTSVVRDLPAGAKPLPRELGNLRYAVEHPFSSTAETMRSIKLALGNAGSPGQVIGVISAMPEEGKSTVAMNLAGHLAASGARTLLIDADLRSPNLTWRTVGSNKPGLINVLDRPENIASVIHVDPLTGLEFMPAGTDRALAEASDLLGSMRLKTFLAQAKANYNYIVMDLSPLLPVVDVRAVAPNIDGFICVVAWGKTARGMLERALAVSDQIRPKLVGCVLNKVQQRRIGLYDQHGTTYYGESYGRANDVTDHAA